MHDTNKLGMRIPVCCMHTSDACDPETFKQSVKTYSVCYKGKRDAAGTVSSYTQHLVLEVVFFEESLQHAGYGSGLRLSQQTRLSERCKSGYLIVFFQVVDALYVCAKRDAVFMKSHLAASKSVKVFDPLGHVNVFELSGGGQHSRHVVSRHVAMCTLLPD